MSLFSKINIHRKCARHAKRVPRQAKHFIIPHSGNNHKPHALRPTALKLYSVAIILIKLFVTAFLFISSPSAGQFATIAKTEILNLTNASRSEASLTTLSLSETLNQAALLKARHMAANGYFAHTAPDGTKPWAFLKQAGYNYSAAGENLAMDFTSGTSVQTAFMNSPSHKKNIMNSKYTEMGIAVIEGELEGRNTTILVEFFGTPYETQVAETIPEPEPAPEPQPETKPIPEPEPQPAEPLPEPQPQPEPQPEPAPVQITSPEPLYYRAELTDQSAEELGIKTLEKITYWADFKNTGTAVWTNQGQYYVALNVTNPAERHSEFEHETWIEYYRPAVLSQARVAPNEVGRFEFTLQAPSEAGVYEESFGLVAEDLTWIDGGSIELPIVVAAPPEKTTELEVEVISTPLSQKPLNASQEPPAVQEQPLAAEEERGPIVHAQTIEINDKNLIGLLISYSHQFYAIILAFLIIALLINILVEIKIQHPHIITQTIIVIIIAGTAIFLHPHFLEQVPKVIKII